MKKTEIKSLNEGDALIVTKEYDMYDEGTLGTFIDYDSDDDTIRIEITMAILTDEDEDASDYIGEEAWFPYKNLDKNNSSNNASTSNSDARNLNLDFGNVWS